LSERSIEDIIRIVEKWQSSGVMHEMTCVVDSRHLPLTATERDGKAVLICPTCKRVQGEIPAVVLGSEEVIDFNLRLFAEYRRREERRIARFDVFWSAALIVVFAACFPGIVGGLTYAVGGGLTGLAFALAFVRIRLTRLRVANDQEDREDSEASHP